MALMKPEDAKVREVNDAEAPTVISLIATVYAEFPNCNLDVDRDEPQLKRPATAFRSWGGRFWVADLDGRILACCAFADRGETLEIKHLYVRREVRRHGLASRFVAMVEAEAASRGKRGVELWTDTRYADSHRLYERLGYQRGERTRKLDDASASVEYYFRKSIAPPVSA